MHSASLFIEHLRLKRKNKQNRSLTMQSLPQTSELPHPSEQPHPNTPIKAKHHKQKRRRYSFDANHTPALKLDISDEELEQKAINPHKIFEFSKSNISVHAERRAHFFFLSLIAYYNTGLSPINGKAYLQYGRGRNASDGTNITQACHSSLFPSFIDETRLAYNKSAQNKMLSCILAGTPLLQNLNATIELPGFVNKIDNEIENTYGCRYSGIQIIQKVAQGQYTPIEGMAGFFIMMEKTFDEMKENNISTNSIVSYMQKDTPDSPREMKKEILEIIKNATFKNKWDIKKKLVMPEYIHLYLGLTKEEITLCNFLDVAEQDKFYIKKSLDLQKEILGDHLEIANNLTFKI